MLGADQQQRRMGWEHACPYWGCALHRDHNAALNILQKGGGTAFGEALPLGAPQNREPVRR
jgi:putative transposase